MAKTKETTLEERKIIVKLHNDLKSERKIAAIVGKPRTTIHYIISRYNQTGTLNSKPRSGRPPKVTDRLTNAIVREAKVNPKIAATKIATNVAGSVNIKITPQTVRNILHKKGLRSRVSRRKFYVSKVNKTKRMKFAVGHADKPQTYWNKIIWSDESKFELFKSKGKVLVWRENGTALKPKNLTPTVKYGGGSVMVWGCMSASGVGKLVFIDGKMDQYVYKNILEENLLASARKLNIEADWIFQHDNDPKHTARSVKNWLAANVDSVLEWPPQSPDLNPIEHLWEVLDKKIRKTTISNIAELKTVIQNEWNKISADETSKLVNSMPKRLQAVRKAKGNPTKY